MFQKTEMSDVAGCDPGWPYPGSRWWKFDFHTHTPASVDYGCRSQQAPQNTISPSEWLLGFMRSHVDCVAVTDHNSGAWFDKLKIALAEMARTQPDGYRPLYLFPGVELSVNGGFHLLAIFDPEKSTSDIDGLLGAVGYHGTKGSSDGVTTKSAVDVVAEILDAGGIPIPAHADRRKGLLHLTESDAGSMKTAIDPSTVSQVLDAAGILAMEVADTGFEKPAIYRDRKLGWTEVLASDSHHPDEGSHNRFPGSHYTWVKMAHPPSLEGLRLALLDGDRFSIRRSDLPDFDPERIPHHCIESLEIADARYMGRGRPATLRFSPFLNAIVGGRGTGKSTIVHALRIASARESEISSLEEGSIPRSTFERFNKKPENRADTGALLEHTRIAWILTRDGVRYRVTVRPGRIPASLVEEETDGCWTPSDPQPNTSTWFPVQILSQGQIAELAGESRSALLGLIDRRAAYAMTPTRRPYGGEPGLEDARAKYLASRARIRELDTELEREDAVVVKLQDVERALHRLEVSQHASVLRTHRRRDRQRREMERQFKGLDDAALRIASLADDLALDDLPEGLLDESAAPDQAFLAVVQALNATMDAAVEQLRYVAERLTRDEETQRERIARSAWRTAADGAAKDHRQMIEQLHAVGVTDPGEYEQLVQERQQLKEDIRILESKKEERRRRVRESKRRLQALQEARGRISEVREAFLSQVLAQNSFIRISVQRYGADPDVLEQSLREALGVRDNRFENDILKYEGGKPKGIVAELLDDLPDGSSARAQEMAKRLANLKGRLDLACHGEGDFRGHFNNYLKRECERSAAFLDGLWAWFPDDGLHVEYSRLGNGRDFRPIGQASAGQKSAAMLAFLLSHGSEPLILDQPEDDLDNHLIYDLVVRQIRENKLERQIIVVTHNPNVVVNGDAEMLHTMDFRGGQCVISRKGSLQDRGMREEVCRIMEGGREAFKNRYRRMGLESTGV